MSDGPHRSLPMKPGWRRVAERCDGSAFSSEEISRAIIPALERDCQGELTPEFLAGIRAVFETPEQYLFDDGIVSRLEDLSGKAGFGIGRTLLDNAIYLSSTVTVQVDTLVTALATTLADRAARCSRQLEEHYLRKSTAPRANNVRLRLEQAIGASSFESLARRILRLDTGKPFGPLLKLQGLDDGVSLQ